MKKLDPVGNLCQYNPNEATFEELLRNDIKVIQDKLNEIIGLVNGLVEQLVLEPQRQAKCTNDNIEVAFICHDCKKTFWDRLGLVCLNCGSKNTDLKIFGVPESEYVK